MVPFNLKKHLFHNMHDHSGDIKPNSLASIISFIASLRFNVHWHYSEHSRFCLAFLQQLSFNSQQHGQELSKRPKQHSLKKSISEQQCRFVVPKFGISLAATLAIRTRDDTSSTAFERTAKAAPPSSHRFSIGTGGRGRLLRFGCRFGFVEPASTVSNVSCRRCWAFHQSEPPQQVSNHFDNECQCIPLVCAIVIDLPSWFNSNCNFFSYLSSNCVLSYDQRTFLGVSNEEVLLRYFCWRRQKGPPVAFRSSLWLVVMARDGKASRLATVLYQVVTRVVRMRQDFETTNWPQASRQTNILYLWRLWRWRQTV